MFVARPFLRSQASTPLAPQHFLSIPYYSVKGDWDSILTLNNSVSSPLAASIILYSLDGNALQLPNVSLLANDVATVRLSELVAQSGDGRGQFQEGSIELRFNHDDGMALASQLTVLDSNHGLSFDIEPPMGFKSSTLESLWWSLDDKTSGQIMLSNTTAEKLDAHLNIEWRGIVMPTPALSLSVHQTIVLDIEKLLKDLGVKAKGIERGGISIMHSGSPSALLA